MSFLKNKNFSVSSAKLLVMFLLVGLITYNSLPAFAGELDDDYNNYDKTHQGVPTPTTAPQGASIPSSPDPNPINTPTTNPDGTITTSPAPDITTGKTTNEKTDALKELNKETNNGLKPACDKGWFSWFSANGVGCEIIGGIAIVFIQFFLFILNIIASFMQWVIQYPILNLSAVTVAWSFLRDLVNLAFVLAIILMSFATMLDVTQYTYRKIFLDIIIGALLINFSLVFMGFFLDMNSIATGFMLNQMGTEQGLADLITNSANITHIATADAKQPLLVLALMPFFMFYIVIAYLVILIPMIIRIVYLIQYAVLSPLTWLYLIFKKADWTRWWAEFITWCFMPTVTLFFIYLAFAVFSPMINTVFRVAGFNTVGNAALSATQIIMNMAVTTVILGTLLMSAVAAAWKGLDKLAQQLIGLATQIGMAVVTGGASMLAKSGVGMAAKSMAGKVAQSGIRQGGIVGGLKTKLGSAVHASVQKLDDTDQRIKNADSKTIDDMRKDYARKTNPNAHDRETMHKLNMAHAEKGGTFTAEEIEDIYKNASAAKDPEQRKKNMAEFMKIAKQLDTEKLNTLIETGAAKDDEETTMELRSYLSEKKKLSQGNQEKMKQDLMNPGRAQKLKEGYKDKLEIIQTAYIHLQDDVLAAGGINTEEGAKKAGRRLQEMDSSERAKVDSTSLLSTTGGAEAVAHAGAAGIETISRGRGGIARAQAYLDKLQQSRGGADHTEVLEALKLSDPESYNAIAKNRHLFAQTRSTHNFKNMLTTEEIKKAEKEAEKRAEAERIRAEQRADTERQHQENLRAQEAVAQAQRDLAEQQRIANEPKPQRSPFGNRRGGSTI